MAISTAAALIGSAVIGAGASAISSRNASKTAANAANYAADQNAQVNREIYNQTRTDLAPYNQAGQGALSALMVRLGLTPMQAGAAGQPQVSAPQNPANGTATAKAAGGFAGTSPLSTPAASTLLGEDGFNGGGGSAPAAASGGVDYARLYQDRPDVMAEYERVAAQADPNSPEYQRLGLDRGPEGFADYWLQSKPPQDTYAAPQLAPTGGTPQTPADPNAPPPQYYQETYAERPDALPVPQYQRPQDMEAPTYDKGPAFSWDPTQIAKDPGFIFETAEAGKGVNANFAARGRLRSGGALKEMQDRLFGVAHTYGNDYFNRALQGYNANRNAFESDRGFTEDRYRFGQARSDDNFINDRSYGTNLWNTQQNRADNIFSEDRGFTANRNDQATSNLFNLVNVGTGAAAGTANAGNVFAANSINNNNNRANTTANAAIANAANTNNIFGAAANAVGTYYGMRGGGSMPRQYNI